MRPRRTKSQNKRRRPLALICVRGQPGKRTSGVMTVGSRAVSVTLGRSGIRANKREGDGATPAGCFHPLRVWWRPDRGGRPPTALPVHRIGADLAWCEDPTEARYNRPFRRSANEPGDRLWRDDHLYDLIVELDHNARPRVKGRGSAVFLHVARPDRSPTAGCVAFSANDLRRLISTLGPKTRIKIHF